MSQPYWRWTGRGRELWDERTIRGIVQNVGNQTKLFRIKHSHLPLVFLQTLDQTFNQKWQFHTEKFGFDKITFLSFLNNSLKACYFDTIKIELFRQAWGGGEPPSHKYQQFTCSHEMFSFQWNCTIEKCRPPLVEIETLRCAASLYSPPQLAQRSQFWPGLSSLTCHGSKFNTVQNELVLQLVCGCCSYLCCWCQLQRCYSRLKQCCFL